MLYSGIVGWVTESACSQKICYLSPLPKFWRNKTEEMAITRFTWKTDIKVVVNGDVDQITRKFTRNTGWTKMHTNLLTVPDLRNRFCENVQRV